MKEPKNFEQQKQKSHPDSIQADARIRSGKTPTKIIQYLTCAVILKFLYHGLRILYRHDERVKSDLDRIDSGTVINLSCSAHGPSLKIISTQNGIEKCGSAGDRKIEDLKKTNLTSSRMPEIVSKPDIDIRFKDLTFAFAVFTGQLGIAESFSKHMMYVNGDFSKIMSLVRCMEQAERYLFPSFITRRILKTLLPKRISSVRLYATIFRSMIVG